MWNLIWPAVNKILVTGLIGSGKSEVCAYLASLGYPVYDSDPRTKALYESVPGLKGDIEKAIGRPFSEIEVIFSDVRKREALEAVVYPLVLDDFRCFCAEAAGETVFFESAVASSKPLFAAEFSKTVLVRAPYGIRLTRNPKAALRETAQEELPAVKADFVIDNNSGLQELHDQVDRMINTFKI